MTDHNKENRMPKLCYVVSAPMTATAFLNGHIDYLADDFDITVVCKFDGSESRISQNADVRDIKIMRTISPINDAVAIWRLRRLLRQEDFQIVHSVTPKAGLISAISGWLARTPVRIHWFTGQVWVLSRGTRRRIMMNLDKLIAHLNTRVLVDSLIQRKFLIQKGVITATKSQVLGSGSIAGVDTSRFRPDPEIRGTVRQELEISDDDAKIIIFIGRLTSDKGIDQLLRVFSSGNLAANPYLLLVGQDENNYVTRLNTILGSSYKRIRYVPHTEEPQRYLSGSDIFCLPSLREGFGLSVIEAGACGLPAVVSDIYGLQSSIIDGETGFFFSPESDDDLIVKLNKLISNEDLRSQMGSKAAKIVSQKFSAISIQKDLCRFYLELLKKDLNDSPEIQKHKLGIGGEIESDRKGSAHGA
jgi:glycosyltransferase involved in cell wall biosynthesis